MPLIYQEQLCLVTDQFHQSCSGLFCTAFSKQKGPYKVFALRHYPAQTNFTFIFFGTRCSKMPDTNVNDFHSSVHIKLLCCLLKTGYLHYEAGGGKRKEINISPMFFSDPIT